MTTIATSRELSLAKGSSKLPAFVVTTLAIASFGPYVTGSIRTEQAALYGLTLALFPMVIARFRPVGGVRFLLPWLAYILVATLGVVARNGTPMPHDAGSLLGGYDNVLAPLAVMLLIWSVVPDWDADRLLIRFLKIVAVAMALNGVLAVLATTIDIATFMRPFWANEEIETTADLAAQMGRYSGIFNQPAEAGALYGIAGLGAIYAWKNRPVFVALLITLMTLGGLISVSKVFIFGGLPMVVLYWFWSQRGGRKIAAVFGIVLIALGVLQSGIFAQWTGANYLGRLFVTSGDQGFLELYSAGRFEEASSFSIVIEDVLAYSPLTGVGAAGWARPYDGAIAEFLVTGGVIGLILFGIVMVGLFTLPLKLAGSARWFAFLFAIVTVGASFGFSPLTANRVSTVSWVIIALLVLVARGRSTNNDKAAPAPHRAGAARGLSDVEPGRSAEPSHLSRAALKARTPGRRS